MVSFLNGMLQYRGEKRLSSDELSEHPFLKKNVREFTKIDTTKVKKKIDNNGLNINIKKNKTIWGFYNENIEQQLIGIGGRNHRAYPPLEKIPEYPQQRRKTDTDIPRIPHNAPFNQNKNYNRTNTNNNAYPYTGQNNGIYGQNIPNQPPYMPRYPDFRQPMISPPYPSPPPPYPPQNQPQSYSSGFGGYDFPTFEPSPYTFASNIYAGNASPSQGQQGYNANYMNSASPVRPNYVYSPMNNDEAFRNGGCSIF